VHHHARRHASLLVKGYYSSQEIDDTLAQPSDTISAAGPIQLCAYFPATMKGAFAHDAAFPNDVGFVLLARRVTV
jgi:hypothetical protein